jgi:hypothetical protein
MRCATAVMLASWSSTSLLRATTFGMLRSCGALTTTESSSIENFGAGATSWSSERYRDVACCSNSHIARAAFALARCRRGSFPRIAIRYHDRPPPICWIAW